MIKNSTFTSPTSVAARKAIVIDKNSPVLDDGDNGAKFWLFRARAGAEVIVKDFGYNTSLSEIAGAGMQEDGYPRSPFEDAEVIVDPTLLPQPINLTSINQPAVIQTAGATQLIYPMKVVTRMGQGMYSDDYEVAKFKAVSGVQYSIQDFGAVEVLAATEAQIKLGWRNLVDATRYEVAFSSGAGLPSSVLTATPTEGSNYTYLTVSPASGKTFSGTYPFTIKAFNQSGQIGVTYRNTGFTIGSQQTPIPTNPPGGGVAVISPTSAVHGTEFECITSGWTNSPTSYQYQWRATVPAGAPGQGSWYDISGATSSKFTPNVLYANTMIACRVTASNAYGSKSVLSGSASVLPTSGGGTNPSPTPVFTPPTAPAPTLSVTYTNIQSGGFTENWTWTQPAVSGDGVFAEYHVQVSLGSGATIIDEFYTKNTSLSITTSYLQSKSIRVRARLASSATTAYYSPWSPWK